MEPLKPPDPAPALPLFEAIGRDTTLVASVWQQIEELIVQGRLQPGHLLPPERELARQFGVSRTVIREAVSGLVARGLLEVRSGSGTVVSTPTVQAVAQSMALLLRASSTGYDYEKVREVRRPLELAIAPLAALRRTGQDVARLEEIMAAAEQGGLDADGFARLDVDFHGALADATQNELFSVMLDSIGDIMFKVRLLGFHVPGNPERALLHHRAILDRVKAGDQQGAYQAMLGHMEEAETTLHQALAMLREKAADTDNAL